MPTTDKPIKEQLRVLTESQFADYAMIYILVSRLVKPIRDWDAYKLGLIDNAGMKLRDPVTSKEKASYGLVDKFVLKIKNLVGHNKLRTLAAFLLLKEATENDPLLTDEELLLYYNKQRIAQHLFTELMESLAENDISESCFWNLLIQGISNENNQG